MDKNSNTTNVAVVVDDHKLFASTFAMLLERTNFFSLVHTFNTEKETADFFTQNTQRNLWLFLDYFIPGVNVHYLISDVHKMCPTARIVIVSNLTNIGLIKKVLTYKIDGIISKTDGVDEVISYLQTSSEKNQYLSATITELLATEHDIEELPDFTSRELDVLSLISAGNNVDEISGKLNLSKHTVITYRRNMLVKSGFRSITELVAYSIKSGIVNGD